jgi:hypothetical protein
LDFLVFDGPGEVIFTNSKDKTTVWRMYVGHRAYTSLPVAGKDLFADAPTARIISY